MVRSSLVRLVACMAMGVVLASCGTPPPTYSSGIVDLGPLGSYGWSGKPLSIIGNISHNQPGPDHTVRLHVLGTNDPFTSGAISMTRSSPGDDARLPTVGHYTQGEDGWELKAIRGFQPYEMTSITISELSYGPPVDESPDPSTPELFYGVTRLRATFTLLLPSGEEVEGFAHVN